MYIKTPVLAVFLLCASTVLSAQTKVEVTNVELSVPFGTVAGTAVLVGDHLIFIDERQVESSFAIARSEIQNITSDGSGVTIETRQQIRDRSGERSRFSLRFVEGDQSKFMNWSRMTPSQTTAPEVVGNESEQMSFPAEYTRRLARNSHGRLMVTGDMLAYESNDRVETSRRWQLQDIKEIKLKNPYEIEIEPFVGGKYKLLLGGNGMDNSEFKTIVDRVTAARISR